jgi:hypothetical protein
VTCDDFVGDRLHVDRSRLAAAEIGEIAREHLEVRDEALERVAREARIEHRLARLADLVVGRCAGLELANE